MLPPPTPLVLKDVTVGPQLKGSSKRQIIFNTSPVTEAFCQFRRGQKGLVDATIRSELSPEEISKALYISEPTIYAGPYLRHFGHFVAECIHRLYAKTYFNQLHEFKVAFLALGWKSNPIEPWLPGVLDICGVSMDEMFLIDRPMRFAELHIPAQARILGGTTLLSGYCEFFPPRESITKPTTTPVYLTRSKHMYSGSFFGETLVEDILQESGFRIISPEAFDCRDLVPILRDARTIVATEGSAIHNLELCGRVGGDVVVIARRPGAASRFKEILEHTANRSLIIDEVQKEGIPLDWDPGMERPSVQRACSFIDISKVINEVSSFCRVNLRSPTSEEIDRSIALDLAQYVLDPRSTRRTTTDEQLGRLLRELRSVFHERAD